MPAQTWTARMIAADWRRSSAPQFRKAFQLESGHGELVSAELFATALGVCEVFVNGRPVSPDVLTPGWSSYEWRLRYAQWDVLELIEPSSVIGMIVGNGWHTGRLGFAGGRALYGDDRAAWVELRLRYADGHTQTVGTDATWESGPSAVLADDLYDGQTIDAGLLDPTWCLPGPSPAAWSGVRPLEFDSDRLTPYVGPPVRRQESISPERVWTSPTGTLLADFGQNLVGWTRIRVKGRRGAEVIVRHAEVLENGGLCTRPLRTAKATDTYILSGGQDEFEPTLTFHGFRYADVTGWPGTPEDLASSLAAVVIGSDMDRIGHFECSNRELNQLHSNIVWSMRGNFVDVPTDCPQRDERLGWTGDLAAFVGTAVFLYDVESFIRDWLRDLAAEQAHAGGMIPLVVPDNFKYENRQGLTAAMKQLEHPVAALWNDAACWVPWATWMAYAKTEALEEEYPSMAAYVRRIALALSEDGTLRGVQLGDWLDPTAPPGEPWKVKANPYVVATACVYRSVRFAESAARALGRDADQHEFEHLAERIRAAFNAGFVRDGRIESDATTAYALAIVFGLLDEPDRQAAGQRLAELVREAEHRITTGFAGTPFITDALTETGHLEDAYTLLLQTECPSWLYPVTMGATTIWERWDSMLPDGSINPGEMTSFNHYAFGAIGDWLHRVVGGLAPLEPGYRTFLAAPQPGGNLTWASTELRTPHGLAAVNWRRDGHRLTVDVTVPEGTTAVLRLPNQKDRPLGPGQHHEVVPYPDSLAKTVAAGHSTA